jgi:hypothetical protein
MDALEPVHLETSLDAIDVEGVVARLKHIRTNALRSTSRVVGATHWGTELSVHGGDGTLIRLRSTSDGPAPGLLLNVDPSTRMASFTLHEPHPLAGPLGLARNPNDVPKAIGRWLRLLSLPRHREWGCMALSDDPAHAQAERAAATLFALNPASHGARVSVPVRNPYQETGAVTVDDGRRQKPCFDQSISDAIVADTPCMISLGRDDGSFHTYTLRAPSPTTARAIAAPDAVARLRLLADIANIRRPLTAAGARAR